MHRAKAMNITRSGFIVWELCGYIPQIIHNYGGGGQLWTRRLVECRMHRAHHNESIIRFYSVGVSTVKIEQLF